MYSYSYISPYFLFMSCILIMCIYSSNRFDLHVLSFPQPPFHRRYEKAREKKQRPNLTFYCTLNLLSPVKTRGYRVELVRPSARLSVRLSRLMWGTLCTRVGYEGVELELRNFIHV